MQGGNQIVETVAFIIKARAALAGDLGQQFRLQYPLARIIALGHIGHHFEVFSARRASPFTSSAMALRVSSGKTISRPP